MKELNISRDEDVDTSKFLVMQIVSEVVFCLIFGMSFCAFSLFFFVKTSDVNYRVLAIIIFLSFLFFFIKVSSKLVVRSLRELRTSYSFKSTEKYLLIRTPKRKYSFNWNNINNIAIYRCYINSEAIMIDMKEPYLFGVRYKLAKKKEIYEWLLNCWEKSRKSSV